MALAVNNSADWQYVDGTVTVVLERQTSAKDTSGGPSLTWVQIAICTGDLQPASAEVKKRFAQLALAVHYTIHLSQDVGALASDRLRIDARNFQIVEGGYEPGYGALTGWPAQAHVTEIPGGV